jgi:hypothetical protein
VKAHKTASDNLTKLLERALTAVVEFDEGDQGEIVNCSLVIVRIYRYYYQGVTYKCSFADP